MLRALLPISLLALCAALSGCGSTASGAPSAAAVVNGHSISYTAYHKQVAYKLYMTEEGNGNLNICKARGYQTECKQMKQDALGDLIAGELVREWAAKHGISVSRTEFQQQWAAEYKGQFHSSHLILVAWAKQLGLKPVDVKNLLRQNILDNKVMYRITRNLPTVTAAVHLDRIVAASKQGLAADRATMKRTGISFYAYAQKLSGTKGSTCAIAGCGDIGWVPVPILPADQRSLASAPVRAIRGPFTGQVGYVLFQVLGKNPHYQLSSQQQLAWRQSIFAHWLLVQRKHATIHRYAA